MKTEFNIGDSVVYPLHGVGVIDRIEEKVIMGNKQLYYILKLSVSDMTSMIPVEKSKKLGLRGLSGIEEVERVIDLLSLPPDEIGEDWKERYNYNYNLVKNGSLYNLSQVIKNSYHRNKIKELASTEKKLFEFALQLLIDEVSASSDLDKDEVEDKITRLLENVK